MFIIFLAKKYISNFLFFGIFWPYYKYPRILVYFSLKKRYPNSENSTVDMDFSSKRKFFVLFLGLNSDVFHYNGVSSKGTAFFCNINYSAIWQLWYITCNKNDRKVLKNSPKNKNYTIIWKTSCTFQIYHQKLVLTLKYTKKRAINRKFWRKLP